MYINASVELIFPLQIPGKTAQVQNQSPVTKESQKKDNVKIGIQAQWQHVHAVEME